jgi:hypothetical protein
VAGGAQQRSCLRQILVSDQIAREIWRPDTGQVACYAPVSRRRLLDEPGAIY